MTDNGKEENRITRPGGRPQEAEGRVYALLCTEYPQLFSVAEIGRHLVGGEPNPQETLAVQVCVNELARVGLVRDMGDALVTPTVAAMKSYDLMGFDPDPPDSV